MTPVERIELTQLALHLGALSRGAGREVEAYRQLPATQRDKLEAHAACLGDHLWKLGKPLPDKILLELACFTPGIQRGLAHPLDCLEESRGGFSPRRLDEAASCLEKLSEIQTFYLSLPSVVKQQLLVLAEEGASATETFPSGAMDILVFLDRLAPKLPHDLPAQLTTEYSRLSTADGQKLARFAVEILDDPAQSAMKEMAEEILWRLACFVENSLSGCHQTLLRNQHFYPGILFRGADAETRDNLISLIESGHGSTQALIALAWIGDEIALEHFRTWRDDPPSWTNSLPVRPELLARQAGWELSPQGTRHDLFFPRCYPLTKPNIDRTFEDGPVKTIMTSVSKCFWCSRNLTVLFDFDLRHRSLDFLDIQGTRLRISTCVVCTCYGVIHTEVDWNGNSVWSAQNKRPDYLPTDSESWDRLLENSLTLSRHDRGVFNAAYPFVAISYSQVGGYPSWVQDEEYPECPLCHRPMSFIAQLAGEDLDKCGEGMYYAFLCSQCGMAATNYQQT